MQRDLILKEFGYLCIFCGEKGGTIDHLISKAKGGTNEKENLACACAICNNVKSDLDYRAFIKAYRDSDFSELTLLEAMALSKRFGLHPKKFREVNEKLKDYIKNERSEKLIDRENVFFNQDIFLFYLKEKRKEFGDSIPESFRFHLQNLVQNTETGVVPKFFGGTVFLGYARALCKEMRDDFALLASVSLVLHALLWKDDRQCAKIIKHIIRNDKMKYLPSKLQEELHNVREACQEKLKEHMDKLKEERSQYVLREDVQIPETKVQSAVSVSFDSSIVIRFLDYYMEKQRKKFPEKLLFLIESYLRKIKSGGKAEGREIYAIGGYYNGHKKKGAHPIVIATQACLFLQHILNGNVGKALDQIESIEKHKLLRFYDETMQEKMKEFKEKVGKNKKMVYLETA